MNNTIGKFTIAFTASIFLAASAAASPYFFPRLRPLFVGLDESRVPASAKNALAEAKIDFQRARHAQPPRFAVYSGPSSGPRGKVYQGHGYQVTIIHDPTFITLIDGPEIVLAPSITGRQPYRYSEVDRYME